jgi:thioredoxin-related protein
VVDFDGIAMEERNIAGKWAVNFTPTTLIFSAENKATQSFDAAEVFRLPGYLKPFHYLSSLEYVVTGTYKEKTFQRYLQDKFSALEAQGVKPDVW